MPKAQKKERSGFWVLSDVGLGVVAAGALGGAAYCGYAIAHMAGFFGDLAWATYTGFGMLATFGYQACASIRELGLQISHHKNDHPDLIAQTTGAPARTAVAAAALCLVSTWNLAAHVRDTIDTEAPQAQTITRPPEVSHANPRRILESFTLRASLTLPQPCVIVVNQRRNSSGQRLTFG